MAKIELIKKDDDGTNEILFHQVVQDNTIVITELLCELNIVDDFNDVMKEKIIELAMALASHDGELNIQ